MDGTNASSARPDRPAAATVRRQELLDVAAALLADRGYHASSMRELAARLNIKAGSLYYHFASKEQLLAELCTIGVRGLVEYLEQAMAETGTLTGRMRAILRGHIAMLERAGAYLHIYQRERHYLPTEARAQLNVHHRRYQMLVDQMFTEARDRGELAPDVEPSSAHWLLVAALTHANSIRPDRSSELSERKADEIADLLLFGLADQAARPAA